MLTAAQKAELRQLLADASPGPWEAYELDSEGYFPSVYLGPSRRYSDNSGDNRPSMCINESHDPKTTTPGAGINTMRATARLIAFLRNHAKELL